MTARAPSVRVFRKRPRLLTILLFLGLFFIVQGIATSAYLLQSNEMALAMRAASVGVGLFLSVVGIWFARNAGRRLLGPAEPITIGPAGLHDGLISDRPIPWSDIHNIHVHPTSRGGSIVAFDLTDMARAAIHWWPWLGEPINRLFGYGYYVLIMGTDADVGHLTTAILPYAPVEPLGGYEH